MQGDSTPDFDELRRQRESLRRRGRLHWAHWTIVGVSILITVLAWYLSNSLLAQRAEQRFDREIDRVMEIMLERLQHYEDALLSGVAAIQSAGGTVTRSQWRSYAANLRLTERYPGIGGIGVIFHVSEAEEEVEAFLERMRREKPDFQIRPQHEFEFRLPIAYIEPEAANAAAIGLDVAFELNRRNAALRARGTGTTQISGPIVLVQDAGKTPGFLFYAPYYERETPPGGAPNEGDAPAIRESTFRGLVYAPLVVRSLVAGTLGQQSRDVLFSIRDGDELLYAEHDDEQRTPSPYTGTRSVELYGRTWTFDFHESGAAPGEIGEHLPTIVLVSGLTIDVLLFGLFAMMSRSNRRFLTLTGKMTDALSRHAFALTATNEELSNYAHVVSHDLKTPIRGIQDITAFLKEDLEGYLASNEANAEVGLNLDRLGQQARKGQALIEGILDYSSVGLLEEERSLVDVRELITEVGRSLGVRPDQLLVLGDMPTFHTHAVRLGQVFENLIGNAFKYHHRREHALVRVAHERDGAFHRFTVADDGPGIEPRFHQRIFEAFTKLQTSHDDSSGIGLSIVKKSVELLGGSIGIESTPGRGTTFRFTWPPENARRTA